MSKKEDMIADDADIRSAEVLTQLTELTVLLTNALGYEPADAQKDEKAGKQVNVERLAAKPITKEQTMVKRNYQSKLMPENMTYKAEPKKKYESSPRVMQKIHKIKMLKPHWKQHLENLSVFVIH